MREKTVFFLFAVLVTGFLFLILHRGGWLTAPDPTASKTAAQQAAQRAERESPFGTRESKDGGKRHAGKVQVASMEEMPEVSAVSTAAAVAPPRYRFPLYTDIAVGTGKPAILESFGSPSITVTGSELGRLQERLVYTDKPTDRKTVIFLVNGRVAGAQTYTP